MPAGAEAGKEVIFRIKKVIWAFFPLSRGVLLPPLLGGFFPFELFFSLFFLLEPLTYRENFISIIRCRFCEETKETLGPGGPKQWEAEHGFLQAL